MKPSFHSLSPEETLSALSSSSDGLSKEESGIRLKERGKNILSQKRKISSLEILINQFKSPLILILLVAGIITLFIHDLTDSIFIFAAVAINAALGFYQEHKAETALESLQTYVKESARVIREGREVEIPAEEVVPGDILSLAPGMRVPADARLLTLNNLQVDESILTGESLPVEKTPKKVKQESPIADQSCCVFGGTYIAEGVGSAVVTATGKQTELGKIAELVKGKEGKTPLQEAMGRFSLKATGVLLIFVAILFVVGISKGLGIFEMFITSVAIAVSAVPEGLPIALTVILAVGVERLTRHKGVVRKLLAAETLGRTTLILTDKTGTLTQAKMKLSKIITKEPKEEILRLAAITLDIKIENPESPPEHWLVHQGPLHQAIAKAAADASVILPELRKKTEILDERPFNSKTKFSAVQIKEGRRKEWVYVGAPEAVIEQIKSRKDEKTKIKKETGKLANEGWRVLAVARENKFLGFLAFKDPVRPGVKKVLQETESAGIKVKIITGDHKGTALSVARELGMNVKDEEVITGEELQKMNDAELRPRLEKIRIFARVAPEDKLRVAELYKAEGEILAMTGDGVNDAPALKAADIGVAVGSGTDVAKGTSDLILLDDNFETLVRAIEEGRKILSNIKKTTIYLLSDSLDELFLIGGALIMGIPLPLNALQILWVNFFSDSFPAIAFAFEDGGNYLQKKVTRAKTKIFDNETKFMVLVIGALASAFIFLLYLILLRTDLPEGMVRTLIFGTFALHTLFLAFALRRIHKSIFTYNPFSNLYLTGGVSIGLLLTLAAIYLPFLQEILKTTPLSLPWLGATLGLSILSILPVEAGKLLFRKH